MKTILVEIPEQIALSLKIPKTELHERLRTELAIRLYQKGILGFGKARELSKVNKWQFQEMLATEGIFLNYDAEELEKDLETMSKFI